MIACFYLELKKWKEQLQVLNVITSSNLAPCSLLRIRVCKGGSFLECKCMWVLIHLHSKNERTHTSSPPAFFMLISLPGFLQSQFLHSFQK